MRSMWILAAVLVCCFAQINYRRPTKVTTRCCTSVSQSIIKLPIIGYTIQNALPPCINATIFQVKTKKGVRKVCTDPNADWVPNKLKGLKEIP
ncbi:hypothetical protein AGOR_G00142990 [Albula goreensis]|uniref:Chemokine interleukin-8-like domain-containing protein n=1 Tax=Albula goreensis TaxID=1534307 RepID=A0A8T3D9A5_9TELE|nr:hypothetical protein AGOR_G00142990 [Albula goreensis]